MASSFQNQEWGQDGWIFLRVYGPRRRNLVNKGFIIRLLVKFCLRDTAGSPERVRWLHLARSSSQSQRAIWFILPARGAGQIIIMVIIISVRAVFLTIESLSMTFTANGKRQTAKITSVSNYSQQIQIFWFYCTESWRQTAKASFLPFAVCRKSHA